MASWGFTSLAMGPTWRIGRGAGGDGRLSEAPVPVQAAPGSTAGLDGQCTFTLVNSDVVNAFAVPGCYIYVTRGLMGMVNSEAELASVLAHELGHWVLHRKLFVARGATLDLFPNGASADDDREQDQRAGANAEEARARDGQPQTR